MQVSSKYKGYLKILHKIEGKEKEIIRLICELIDTKEDFRKILKTENDFYRYNLRLEQFVINKIDEAFEEIQKAEEN